MRISDKPSAVSGSIDAAAMAHLFDFVPGTLFYMKGRDGTWLACNQLTLSFLAARSIDQLKGKSELDLFPRAVAEAVRRDDRRVLGKGETIIDRIETLIDPIGAMVWAKTTKLPLRAADGTVGGLIGITRLLDNAPSAFPCPELQPVIAFVEAHFREPIRIARLAALACVSVAGLRSRFHRHLNLTPHQFVMRTRMQAAAGLLRSTAMPIAEIAVSCGFYDQNQFTRLFSTYFGSSPRRFRTR